MTRHAGRLVPLALATVAVAACAASTSAGGPLPSAPLGGAAIVADDLAFDRGTLEVPAGRPFPLVFENREGVPHNVTIVDGDSGQVRFAGDIFGGPASRTYEVPALAVGTHRFRCDVHLEMAGEVLARPR